MEAAESVLLLVFTDQVQGKTGLEGQVSEIRYGKSSTGFLSKEQRSWNPLKPPMDIGLTHHFLSNTFE